jgi:iron complex outermembrane receptor protein
MSAAAPSVLSLRPLSLLIGALLASTAQAAAPAREDARTLDRLEVRERVPGAYAPLPLEAARLRIEERAGGVGIVDGEAYRGGRVSTLTDALGLAPGVFVQSRFGAEEARVSIRGSGLQRTFHGRGLRVLQDGVPINLADGGFDMQSLEPLAARYIEVYRGANALEYGAATLGGAINFVSPTGHDLGATQARLELGSFGYQRSQASLGAAGARLDGVMSLSGFVQDGFRDNAEQATYRAFGNLGWRASDALESRLYLAHVHTRSALPGALTFAQFAADPAQANPGSVALDQRRDFELSRLSGVLAWQPSDSQRLQFSAFYSDKQLDHPIFQVLLQDSRDRGVDLRWRMESTLAGQPNVLVAGLGYSRGDTRDDRFQNLGGRRGNRTAQSDQLAENRELFIENQWQFAERFTLATGVQALRASRDFSDLFRAGGVNRSFATRYSGSSPKLGLRFAASARTTLFGNLSDSREPPSFGELAGGPGITQVDQQRGRTLELGLRHRSETLQIDAAAYRARLRDELLALNDAAGNPLGTINAERTLHQGLEFGLAWQFVEALRVDASYLYNDFRFQSDAVYGDNDLAGVPPQLLRAQLRWAPSARFSLTPGIEWSPQRSFIDHANTLAAPGYTVLHLRAGLALGASWQLFADLRNVTDRRYVASTGVVADARGRDGAYLLPGDGRGVFVGLQWRPRG